MNTEIVKKVFKSGYEKRICEQLQMGLNGIGQSSSYNEEELDKSANEWLSKNLGKLNKIRDEKTLEGLFSSDKFIERVCMCYKHINHLNMINEIEMQRIKVECKEWMGAILHNLPFDINK